MTLQELSVMKLGKSSSRPWFQKVWSACPWTFRTFIFVFILEVMKSVKDILKLLTIVSYNLYFFSQGVLNGWIKDTRNVLFYGFVFKTGQIAFYIL